MIEYMVCASGSQHLPSDAFPIIVLSCDTVVGTATGASDLSAEQRILSDLLRLNLLGGLLPYPLGKVKRLLVNDRGMCILDVVTIHITMIHQVITHKNAIGFLPVDIPDILFLFQDLLNGNVVPEFSGRRRQAFLVQDSRDPPSSYATEIEVIDPADNRCFRLINDKLSFFILLVAIRHPSNNQRSARHLSCQAPADIAGDGCGFFLR